MKKLVLLSTVLALFATVSFSQQVQKQIKKEVKQMTSEVKSNVDSKQKAINSEANKLNKQVLLKKQDISSKVNRSKTQSKNLSKEGEN